MKNFDFSYPYARKKKKKLSILPTISARFFAVFILLCVFTAAAALFFILPKADIAIALKQEETKGDFSFVLSSSATEINEETSIIPMAKTDITSEKTQTFTTTSKKQVTEKATGEITIYNECSTGPQVLVAGTRFLSKADGKIFKIEETATVPGFTKPEADTVAGQKTVKVVAADAGEAYNIAATSFTIPAYQEKGDWRYSCLYGKSGAAMTGGLNKEVAYVSKDDYDKAQKALTDTVTEENNTKISEQKSDSLIYINDAGKEPEITANASAKVDDVADSFSMTVTVKKQVLSVTKKNLEDLLAREIAKKNNSANAKPVEGSLFYNITDTVEKDKELSMNVSASENFTYELDQDKIKKEVAGKNKEELNGYFAQMNGVKSVSINLWPFWVNKVPDSLEKINITLDISDSV